MGRVRKSLSEAPESPFLKWHYYLKVLDSDKDYVYGSAKINISGNSELVARLRAIAAGGYRYCHPGLLSGKLCGFTLYPECGRQAS
jgi:hypothetical protein